MAERFTQAEAEHPLVLDLIEQTQVFVQAGAGEMSINLNWRGTWTTATEYYQYDMFHHDGSGYLAVTQHTSGVFATDLADGKVALYARGAAIPGGVADQFLRKVDSEDYNAFWDTVDTSDIPPSTDRNYVTDLQQSMQQWWDIVNGTFYETFDALVTSDGVTVTCSLEQDGTGDLQMRFSDGLTTLDCTPAATVTLTAGTDTVPVENFVYIPQSTKVLTVSTSDWPGAEHIKVTYALVPSASFVQSDGPYINQNWNDHAADSGNQGHLTHMAERSRYFGAMYHDGVAGNGATSGYITVASGATPDDVWFLSTAGTIFQMHRHSFGTKDSATDDILVFNDNTAAYSIVNNLNTVLTDATGSSMSGKYFNLVFGGVANKGDQGYSPLFMNLPNGSYNAESDALADADGNDVYSIPRPFNKESSTGFLICRITLKHSPAGGGSWTVSSTTDLRGETPSTVNGGVSGDLTVFSAGNFRVFDPTSLFEIDFDLTALTANRSYTFPDYDGHIGAWKLSGSDIYFDGGNVGIGISSPVNLLHARKDSTSGTEGIFANHAGNPGSFVSFTFENQSTENDRMNFGLTGTGYSAIGAFKQNAGFISASPNVSGGLSFVSRHDSADIRFYTAGFLDVNERMTIKSTGLIGINETAPGAMLDIESATATDIGLLVRGAAGQTAQYMQILPNSGNVLGTKTSPAIAINDADSGFYSVFPGTLSYSSHGATIWLAAANTGTTPGKALRLASGTGLGWSDSPDTLADEFLLYRSASGVLSLRKIAALISSFTLQGSLSVGNLSAPTNNMLYVESAAATDVTAKFVGATGQTANVGEFIADEDFKVLLDHTGTNGDGFSLENLAVAGDDAALRVYNEDNTQEIVRFETYGSTLFSKYIGLADEVDNGDSGAAATITWRDGNYQLITFTASCTLTYTAPPRAGPVTLVIVQGGTGSYTATHPATFKRAGGTDPTLSVAIGAKDILEMYFDGTNYNLITFRADVK